MLLLGAIYEEVGLAFAAAFDVGSDEGRSATQPHFPRLALPRHSTVLERADKSRTWSFASTALTPFSWDSDDRPEWTCDASIVEVGALSLISIRHWGGRLHARIPGMSSHYDLHIAVAGRSRLVVADTAIALDRTTAAIASPRMAMELLHDDGYDQFHVKIAQAAIERNLERALGRSIFEPVRFDPSMDLQSAQMRNWIRAVALFVDDLGSSQQEVHHTPWTDLLISKLLNMQHHNYSEELQDRTGSRPLPYRVRRVREFIDARPDAEFSMAELSTAVGVSSRSLYRDFRLHLGVTPREYLEQVRLERAHEDLLTGIDDSVTTIATRWGFTHLARFAARYRERYGETPSQALRRAR